MKGGVFLGLAVSVIFTMPAVALEAYDLDSVEITYPGEYLGPPNLYMLVPPPVADGNAGEKASIYNSQTVAYQGGTATRSGSRVNSTGFVPAARTAEPDEDNNDGRLRVRIIAGTDNATDVPVSVIEDYFKDSEIIEVVGEGRIYDILVQVETMKLETSPIVFIVLNAYKDFGDKSLIIYNDYGYLGDMRLNAGSVGFAEKLETALEEELGE